MKLSALTAYAEKTYHILEQKKWAGFPGFSVLSDPKSGRWIALLIRRRDFFSGRVREQCDIRCGRDNLPKEPKSYLSEPFRMQGRRWVGVTFDERTEEDVVFRLFDKAAAADEQQGYLVILEEKIEKTVSSFVNTLLPFAGGARDGGDPSAPKKIREMYRLYEYGRETPLLKSRNFYAQGKFMEDFEDDAPWNGELRHYFPTYHDLNIRQLRGYFTWRTALRKGEYRPICASLAYLYLYELLYGIGASSPEDALNKMKAFEKGYLDAGYGDARMRENLRRWTVDYALLQGLPAETVKSLLDPAVLARDEALSVLQAPEVQPDETVFSALRALSAKDPASSPVFKKAPEKGLHLFAAFWRCLMKEYRPGGKDIFTLCFGERKAYAIHPLSNTVYRSEEKPPDTEITVSPCRRYRCRGGRWEEERFEPLYFDKKAFSTLLHEMDRVFRKNLKTGSYLKPQADGVWAEPYLEAFLAAEKKAEEEAARPVITIDLSGLDRIRQDAAVTQDSLMTDAEREEAPAPPPVPEEKEEALPVLLPSEESGPAEVNRQILGALLEGRPAEEIIRAHHLLPQVAADTINEALYDEIGDSVLACEGDQLTLVEDYIEDVRAWLEENA